MFDIGWSEMAVVALLALIVIGPKDLPRVMRTVGKWVRKARSVASDFQSSLDDMMRESELDEARRSIDSARHYDPTKEFEKTVDPTGSVGEEARRLESDARREASDDEAEESGTSRRQVLGGGDKEAGAEGEEAGEGERAEVRETPYRQAPAHSVSPPGEAAEGEASEHSASQAAEERGTEAEERGTEDETATAPSGASKDRKERVSDGAGGSQGRT